MFASCSDKFRLTLRLFFNENWLILRFKYNESVYIMINIKGAMRGEFIREKIGVDEDRKIKRRKEKIMI